MDISLLILLLLLAPLAGFAINGVGFRIIPRSVAPWIGVLGCMIPFGVSVALYQLFRATGDQPISLELYRWIDTPAFSIAFSVLIDQLTLVMLLMVTGIGTLIHVYSASYMSHDAGLGKFFAFLNLFIFSMLLLVVGGNYLVMFVGWEGVGLCSFLLIGFWNTVPEYNAAARKAFVMNRIGDLGLLLALFLILMRFGTLEYTTLFPQVAETFGIDDPELILITMLLFVGATGKSAQIPLYTWLPDAMAGPTPVSALIHAATMVTAGIYLVIRSNALFTLAPFTLEVIAIIGVATALLGALIGLKQNDIKRVLAYSTVSQLGYMFLALGVGAYVSSIFHVWTHAFFKALMFLGAGSVIHAVSGQQDIRSMGGLRAWMPITFITFTIGVLAIAGIPPFAGFFSKDEILFQTFLHSKPLYALGLLTSGLTAFYMGRLYFLTFFGEFRGSAEERSHLHESPSLMTIPLVVLAIGATLVGFMGLPEALGGNHLFAQFINPVLIQPEAAHGQGVSHELELALMGASVLMALAGLGASYIVYIRGRRVPEPEGAPMTSVQRLVYNKFYVDEAYQILFAKPLAAFSRVFYTIIEFLVIDLAVHAIARVVQLSGRGLRHIQSGAIPVYMFVMVAMLVALLLASFFGDRLVVAGL